MRSGGIRSATIEYIVINESSHWPLVRHGGFVCQPRSCDKLFAVKPKKKPSRNANSTKAAKEESSARVREEPDGGPPEYGDIITVEPGKRGGRPCIRGMRITVGDVLGWLAAGMSEKEILRDYPELTSADIRASLAYAAERENRSRTSWFSEKWAGKLTLPKSDPNDSRRDYLLKKYWRHRG